MYMLLMEEILLQLICSLTMFNPHDLQGLYIPGGAGILPSTASYQILSSGLAAKILQQNIPNPNKNWGG